MISAFAGYQQSSAISLLQGTSENSNSQKAQPAGPRNMLAAVQQHTDGTRQAFDEAASQIVTAFMDSLQNKISDEPNKGANNAGSLTNLTAAEFESSLSISASFMNSNGMAAVFDMEAFAGLSFEMEIEDGVLTGFNLEFEMETEFAFSAQNGSGGYQQMAYSNSQSFSISYSFGEDDDGNIMSELSFERSEVTQVSYLSMGDQDGLGFGAGMGSLEDIASFMDNGGTQGQFGPPPPPPEDMTGQTVVQMQLESALEILKSITEYQAEETETSLFSDNYYLDDDEYDDYDD